MSDRVKILKQVYVAAEAKVKERPTRENISAFDEAAKRLDDALIGLDESTGFETQEASILYLNKQGWKIGKSKFSTDYKGNLIAKRDGKFLTDDLDHYAEYNLEKLDNSPAADQQISEKEKLVKEQRRKLERANEQAEGRLTPTADIERMLASRAARLKADMDQFWRDNSKAIVRLVGGDESKIPDLIEYGQDKTDEHFSLYAEPYHVEK